MKDLLMNHCFIEMFRYPKGFDTCPKCHTVSILYTFPLGSPLCIRCGYRGHQDDMSTILSGRFAEKACGIVKVYAKKVLNFLSKQNLARAKETSHERGRTSSLDKVGVL